MVSPTLLVSDIVADTVFVALPGLLWVFLFLWSWDDPTEARAAGFGRRTFWLLLPAAFAASAANAPFFTWDGSVLAINLGGGLVPLILAGYLPARSLGDAGRRTIRLTLVALALETAAMFLVALRFPGGGGWADLGVGAIAAATVGIVALWSVPAPAADAVPRRAVLFLLSLSAIALVLTYATTQAVPGVGILSVFPYYLVGPIVVGVLAVALLPRVLPLPRLAGIPFGYAAATFGVLIGADVLHQPPLYGRGVGILSIGGAGLLDLVYLTGLLAAFGGFLTLRGIALASGPRAVRPADASGAGPPTPMGQIRVAARYLARGDLAASLRVSASAADAGVARLRALRGLPPAGPSDDPWAGTGVTPWVKTDQFNLRALARVQHPSPSDALRGLNAARLLVLLAAELSRESLGTVRERILAFLIDLGILTAPAAALVALVAATQPGGSTAILLGVPFNAAVFGYIAYGVGYFALAEGFWGTTIGKRRFGLVVRTRELGRPGIIALLLRNLPRVVPLAILGELGGTALVLLLNSSGPADASLVGGIAAGFLLLAAGFGLMLSGALTAAVMQFNPERDRLGDLWAGTIVRRARAGRFPTPAPAPVATGAPSASMGS